MKKLLKGVMGITSIAVMAAGAYYLTKKLIGEPDEELDDEMISTLTTKTMSLMRNPENT